MGKLNLFHLVIFLSQLYQTVWVAQAQSGVCVAHDGYYNRSEDNSSTNFDNGLSVTPILYELQMKPILALSNINNSSRTDGIRYVSVLTRVLMTVADSGNNGSRNILRFTADATQFHLEACQISHIGSENQPEIADIEHDDEGRYVIYFHLPPNVGTVLEVKLAYTLELKRFFCGIDKYEDPFETNKESLHGFIIFDGTTSCSKSGQGPIGVKNMIPTFGRNDQRSKFSIYMDRPADEFVTLSNMEMENTTEVPDGDMWVRDTFLETLPLQVNQIVVMLIHGLRNLTVYDTPEENSSWKETVPINIWYANCVFDDYHKKSLLIRTGQEIRRLYHYFREYFNWTDYPVDKLDFMIMTGFMDGCSTLGSITAFEDYPWANSYYLKPILQGLLARQLASQWIGAEVITAEKEMTNLNGKATGLINYVTGLAFEHFYDDDERREAIYGSNTETRLLLMMDDVFSAQVVRSAIADFYLPKTKWRSVFAIEFYDSLQDSIVSHNVTSLLPPVAGITVKDVMTNWLQLPGLYPYPLTNLNVSHVEGDRNSISISCGKSVAANTTALWIPVKIVTEQGKELTWIFCDPSANSSDIIFSSDIIDRNKCIFVNPITKGSVAVNYSPALLKNIIDQLHVNHSVVPIQIRHTLMNDPINFDGDWEDMKMKLERMTYLKEEVNGYVWTVAADNVGSLYKLSLPNDGAQELVKMFFGGMMNSVINKIGGNITTLIPRDEYASLVTTLMEYCGTFEVEPCLEFAAVHMDEWLRQPNGDQYPSRFVSWFTNEFVCAAVQDSSYEEEAILFHSFLEKVISFDCGPGCYPRYNQMLSGLIKGLTCLKNESFLFELFDNPKIANGSNIFRVLMRYSIPWGILNRVPLSVTVGKKIFNYWLGMHWKGDFSDTSFLMKLNDFTLNVQGHQKLLDLLSDYLNQNISKFAGEAAEWAIRLQNKITLARKNTNGFWSGNSGQQLMIWLKERA